MNIPIGKLRSIVFTSIERDMVPQQQMFISYFIDELYPECRYIRIRPLTLSFLLWSIVRNNSIMLYWFFLRCLYLAGFLDIKEFERFSWKHFTLNFIRTLKSRNIYEESYGQNS